MLNHIEDIMLTLLCYVKYLDYVNVNVKSHRRHHCVHNVTLLC